MTEPTYTIPVNLHAELVEFLKDDGGNIAGALLDELRSLIPETRDKQWHDTAWQRGHAMGMASNAKIAKDATEALRLEKLAHQETSRMMTEALMQVEESAVVKDSFTTERTTLQERSKTALACLPDAPYKDMLAALHADMLAADEADKRPLRYRIHELEGEIIGYKRMMAAEAVKFDRLPPSERNATFQLRRAIKAEDECTALRTALAQTRDAYPIPETGTHLEELWANAMADAAEIPAYIEAVLAAERASTAQEGDDLTIAYMVGHGKGVEAGAKRAQQVAVPQGWKLVPIDPTPEMINAYVNADGRFHSARSDWGVILAAAPHPPCDAGAEWRIQCPHCGGDTQGLTIHKGSHVVECQHCLARGPQCDDAASAKAAWATRTAPQSKRPPNCGTGHCSCIECHFDGAKSKQSPCDAGSVCLDCQPRNADGSCPDAAPKPPQAATPKPCTWTEDSDGYYSAECGECFAFNEGTPAQNKAYFCHHCGGKIEVKA